MTRPLISTAQEFQGFLRILDSGFLMPAIQLMLWIVRSRPGCGGAG
eukprot:CAMPEP_0177726052 /NCGR_PEP_ID=MMETSP0484_2-20121128/19573_1 /TAXON_ID=354590 /ORGANISM="Rhodomonas lens, Strain RHODO" /LENGTH=45 /DNA_ID= /DNA_START= /DNA_END= /DNA_ORIENTATION=